MEITKLQTGETTELKVAGRLDAYWSEHLSNELKGTIREGIHHIVLDLSAVDYISSAGIRVLLTYFGQLNQINGTLAVSKISNQAKSVLEMAGLYDVLMRRSVAPVAVADLSRKSETQHATFELFTLQSDATLSCRLLGRPELLERFSFEQQHAEKIRVTKSSFAFGIGAFGDNWEECKDRCGEFLAAAGAAAYLPTDRTNVPDYIVSSGNYSPELLVLSGAICTGGFSHLLRFDAKKESGVVPLVEVVEKASQTLESPRVGLVLIAESAGLVGASILKTPIAQSSRGTLFDYPETVDWLSFTAERAHSRSLALVVGMTDRDGDTPTLLRPIDKKKELAGHFHAAAFPYHPLRKGELQLESTISTLFETGSIEGVLHLLNDDREIGGAGESEFIRGACWISRITKQGK